MFTNVFTTAAQPTTLKPTKTTPLLLLLLSTPPNPNRRQTRITNPAPNLTSLQKYFCLKPHLKPSKVSQQLAAQFSTKSRVAALLSHAIPLQLERELH